MHNKIVNAELAQDKIFATMLQQHAKDIIKHLIKRGVVFSILCNVPKLSFNPMLDVLENLLQFSVFVLAGYTFESVEVGEDFLQFEAGFGKDNEGSFVHVPFSAIVQISLCSDTNLQENVIFTNIFATLDDTANKGIADSMRAFLQNPENQHLKQ